MTAQYIHNTLAAQPYDHIWATDLNVQNNTFRWIRTNDNISVFIGILWIMYD